MRMSSSCMNCGTAKENGDFLANYCSDCNAAIEGYAAAAVAEGKDPAAARRLALSERAHRAHRNFADPRLIDRRTIWLEGNRPAPPEPTKP